MFKHEKDNLAFPLTILVILLVSGIFSFFGVKEINEYENRTADKLPVFSISGFLDGSFQDGVERGMADQIPLSELFKRTYNELISEYTHSALNKLKSLSKREASWNTENSISEDLLKEYQIKDIPLIKNKNLDEANYPFNYNDNRFYAIYNDISVFNGHLVVNEVVRGEEYRQCNLVKSVNKIVDFGVETYYYCVERESDINLLTGKGNGNYELISGLMNLDGMHKGRFNFNSFSVFDSLFYKTDFHWNHRGAYIGYRQILKMLKGNENPMYPKAEYVLGTGGGGRAIGDASSFTDYYSAYEFDYPRLEFYSNGVPDVDCTNVEYYLSLAKSSEKITDFNYEKLYGHDRGERRVHNLDSKGNGNLLVFNDSFNDATIRLLACHYDNLYSIDLRYYERDFGKSFDYRRYITDNDIDTVLFLGATGEFLDRTVLD